MSDKFSRISIQRLFQLTFVNENEIFGIPKELFFVPSKNDKFKTSRFGQKIETPLGVAAGPQTQMAQNIIAAWLTGARYIELKTIQTLDELEVSKPCIDMQDEGYNCEWSQELKIHESFDEYLNAWIMLHILRDKFGFEKDLGTIFNMSVGYNLEGILKDNVQWFFKKMKNCKAEKDAKIQELKSVYPNVVNLNIPDTISDNITLSTMHGCPPDEIEKIGLYLINELKLNTIVKLNPTLLGFKDLRNILNTKLGYAAIIPDIAFEHDLKYPDSLNIIKSLQNAAKTQNVHFGLKLTNTLESVNIKNVFDKSQEMMYMSGRALHPISINVVRKLQNEFNGKLDVSFSAGADCFNVTDLFSCGLKTVTVSSDLLKPGGYGRMQQYVEEMRENFADLKAESLDDLALKMNKKTESSVEQAALENLNKYADMVVESEAYKDHIFHKPNIKTQRELKAFDCIAAPCVDTCPTNQDIPEYLFHVANNDVQAAYNTIMKTNPFPSVLGMVCDHMCQSKCTRVNYDNNLLIREVKRFVMENSNEETLPQLSKNNVKVAIIGAGPSGLSAAYFLALNGYTVEVFESKAFSGGMVSDAIPAFRLTKEALDKDITRIEKLGVKINYNQNIDKAKFADIQKQFTYTYIAVGAQKAKDLGIEGSDAQGVLDPLKFLSDVKNCTYKFTGKNVAVIGGGNTAMDTARTVYRLVKDDGKVTILYRRTIKEMPADMEEVQAVLEEGIGVIELVAPEKVVVENGKVKGIVCSKMQLGEADEKGRRKPVKIANSEHVLEFDTIIPALGQDIVLDFLEKVSVESNFETSIPNVFIGGDAYRGAATIIKAVADGKNASYRIMSKADKDFGIKKTKDDKKVSYKDLIVKRAKRNFGQKPAETDLKNRKNFDIVISGLTKEQAVAEASRCLYCDEVCNVCVSVCPNRANYSYKTEAFNVSLPKVVNVNGKSELQKDVDFKVAQAIQIVNLSDFCNECANCTTFCPTAGAPFKDKPKFYLTDESFALETSGYTIKKENGKKTIIYKQDNKVQTLTLANDVYTYNTEDVTATFDAKFNVKSAQINNNASEVKLRKAAEMKVLLEGIENLY